MGLEALIEITCLIFPLYGSGLLWGADNGERDRDRLIYRERQEREREIERE